MTTAPEFMDDEAWSLWGELEDMPSKVSYDQVAVIQAALCAAYNDGFNAGAKAATGTP